ncbi:MAG: hypothetical protein R3A80_01415 [Bdellovibrionota bacterium]
MRNGYWFFIVLLSFSAFPWKANAWGERGHHTVCDEASRLVTEPVLRDFLKTRGHIMGHACNVPDIHWKSLPPDVSGIGNPTHYIEPDMLGLSIKDTPTDFSDFIAKLSTLGDASQLVHKVGTLWWRADQLFNLAVKSATNIAPSALPTNSMEEQLNSLPYNEAIYGMMTNMGIMGHFLGDASMPYHNLADYDGYGAGRGGIHAYYESICPGEFGSELGVDVRDVAMKLPKYASNTKVTTVLKKISQDAVDDLGALEKLDVILEPSTQAVNEHGMTIKKPALRPAPAEQCQNFRPLIVLEIARSAKGLAYLWDQIYIKAGKPNLAAYKSYRYPLTPDFVRPEYLGQ